MYFGQYYMCTILSYFILLALQKKQTNKQKNVGKDTATAVANYYSGPG